jgi:hypothetical protein
MITLIAAAALAAQAPVVPANPPADAHAQHAQMQMSGQSEHQGMDCCKDCCKDMMAKMHEGHGSEHSDHAAH